MSPQKSSSTVVMHIDASTEIDENIRGAAGAIAAAFNAPLTGAFHAFELIVGTCSFVALAPVASSRRGTSCRRFCSAPSARQSASS